MHESVTRFTRRAPRNSPLRRSQRSFRRTAGFDPSTLPLTSEPTAVLVPGRVGLSQLRATSALLQLVGPCRGAVRHLSSWMTCSTLSVLRLLSRALRHNSALSAITSPSHTSGLRILAPSRGFEPHASPHASETPPKSARELIVVRIYLGRTP
jgi:hypothetical protein